MSSMRPRSALGLHVRGHVDQVALDGLRVDDVGRLDHARDRHAAVGDVDRVVRADALLDARDQADDAHVAQRVGAELGSSSGASRTCRFGRSCVVTTVSCSRRPSSVTTPSARPGPRPGCGGRAWRCGLAAARADALREPVDQRLVAALDRAHDLAPALGAGAGRAAHARPQVRRGQVVVAAVELGVQQRRPQALPEPVAAVARAHSSSGSRRAPRGRRSGRSAARTRPAAPCRRARPGNFRTSAGVDIEQRGRRGRSPRRAGASGCSARGPRPARRPCGPSVVTQW